MFGKWQCVDDSLLLNLVLKSRCLLRVPNTFRELFVRILKVVNIAIIGSKHKGRDSYSLGDIGVKCTCQKANTARTYSVCKH